MYKKGRRKKRKRRRQNRKRGGGKLVEGKADNWRKVKRKSRRRADAAR